ncbi:GIN domain-containing protein [Pedobacter mucosus]|uniref:GIN domain-containing protein n=1 Tax=Pedobacter mucosus TaxID=2895286 RepID=UPI001EE48B42|nr:DUF2807 domain-containing protein [Pedobacter mucosus]UKT65111.1 DUF2807 domain-containing protein [Pedobacter mucosus]
MKNSIQNLIASSLTAIVLTSTLFTTSVSAVESSKIKVAAPVSVKRVYVKGNVEITLIQRVTEGVTYSDDNTGNAKIVQDGDILRISSTDKNVAKLVVYVKDIYRIEASENAVIKTNGKISIKFLQVFLNGNAHADLNTSTEGLYTIIKDNAELKLSGSTDNHSLVMGKTSKLTIERFAALKTNISATETAIETNSVEKEIASIK